MKELIVIRQLGGRARFGWFQARIAVAVGAVALGGLSLAPAALAGTPGVVVDFAGDGSMGAPTPGPATSSALGATQVAADAAGNVYIADVLNNEIEKVTPGGTLSIIAGTGTAGAPTPGPATSSELNYPSGVAVDNTGNLYIADANNNEIEKVTPGGTLSIIAGTGTAGAPTAGPATSSELSSPYGVAADASGNVYIADYDNNMVERVTPAGSLTIIAGTGTGGSPTPGPATSSQLNNPTDIAVDTAGNVYIADTYNNAVEKVTPAGNLTIIAGTGTGGSPTPGPATSSELNTPQGVALDAAGNLYIADYSNYDVEEVTPGGTLSIIAGTGTGALPTWGSAATNTPAGIPSGVTVDPAGDVFFTPGNGYVAKIFGPAPANTGLPQITGNPTVGQTLTAASGSWWPAPSSYSYQWQICDPSGNSCVDITGATSSSYALTSQDVGHTLRVAVTASNADGTANATSLQSRVVAAIPPAAQPPPPLPPHTPPVRPDGGVVVPWRVARAQVRVSSLGRLKIPLVCHASVSSGCHVDGTLSIRLPGEHHQSIIARFHGVLIARGHKKPVTMRLDSTILRALQARGITRVRLILVTRNHLPGDVIVTSAQDLWLSIPALVCKGDGDQDADDRGAWCERSPAARRLEPAVAEASGAPPSARAVPTALV